VVERTAVGVLGVITAGLALAALAAQPGGSPPPQLQPTRPAAAAPSAAALKALRDGARIDVNSASAADLELLPGVGPTLAKRIVSHRASEGPFGGAEDLLQVHGIGRRTLERLAPLMEFGAGSRTTSQPSNIQTSPAVTPK
jgi:competence ComEA-like helix-hairpin-helix protein